MLPCFRAMAPCSAFSQPSCSIDSRRVALAFSGRCRTFMDQQPYPLCRQPTLDTPHTNCMHRPVSHLSIRLLEFHMEGQSTRINNAFYEELAEAWYDDDTHPIALL